MHWCPRRFLFLKNIICVYSLHISILLQRSKLHRKFISFGKCYSIYLWSHETAWRLVVHWIPSFFVVLRQHNTFFTPYLLDDILKDLKRMWCSRQGLFMQWYRKFVLVNAWADMISAGSKTNLSGGKNLYIFRFCRHDTSHRSILFNNLLRTHEYSLLRTLRRMSNWNARPLAHLPRAKPGDSHYHRTCSQQESAETTTKKN